MFGIGELFLRKDLGICIKKIMEVAIFSKERDRERSDAGPSRESFSKKKMKRLIAKKNLKIHRGYGDLFAVKRFKFSLNLLQQI